MTKEEQFERFEKREAEKRQRLEMRERRLQEDQHKLELDWQRFKKEYDERRKFLKELWSEDEDGMPQPELKETQDRPTPQHERSQSSNGTSKRPVTKEVKLIVDGWPDDAIITQSEVTQRFVEMYPDHKINSLVSLVSHTLSQLSKGEDRLLDLVRKGAGSRPSTYRKRPKVMNMEP